MYWLVLELKRGVWGEEVKVVEGWWEPGLYYMENLSEDLVYWLVLFRLEGLWVMKSEGEPDLYYMDYLWVNPVYWLASCLKRGFLCGVLLVKKGGVLGKQEGVRGCLDFAILLICHCTHHVLCLSFSTFSRSYQGRVRRERDRVVFSS